MTFTAHYSNIHECFNSYCDITHAVPSSTIENSSSTLNSYIVLRQENPTSAAKVRMM